MKYIYDYTAYQITSNGAEMIDGKIISSNSPLKVKKWSTYNNKILKCITVMSAPEEYMKEYGSKRQEPRTKQRRKSKK